MELKTFQMNGQELLVELWDSSSGYKRIEDCNDVEKVDGVIVVYDITNLNSFKRIPEWITQIKQFVPDDVLFLILGSHQDLYSSRQVCLNDGLQTANEFDALFHEVSAKTGDGINETMDNFIRAILLCKNGIELAVEVDVKSDKSELGKIFIFTAISNYSEHELRARVIYFSKHREFNK
ncbi:ras-related protein Rab-6B-like isoform X2 [Stegodyphus dumicola]|uniref:ras-related protein Rab-6B-like isoform X2 n=1 Tax=Stegodyphus dumicola TaxID=202533 RepID=UPI0015A7D28D|nr:ras-related protein Rab-6B-like isoform X2 [Stegodyphus dumicola]